jgi:ubiquinone/menaquinone biosynthesis C-methylase UbiE
MSFKDHFSRIAANYTRYRPHYPKELFAYLASLAAKRDMAWDCATGNGQAALGLAQYFDQVIATDASAQQLDNAIRHEKIIYKISAAEKTDIESASVDLVTVAQALHWFDLDGFYKEARRVLKPGGIIAVWVYRFIYVSDEIDRLLEQYHEDVVKPYWSHENSIADERFHSIPFPFDEVSPPTIRMEASWDLEQIKGFLGTWSATQRYKDQNNIDPVEIIADRLQALWGDPLTRRKISWPLILRIGRIPDNDASEGR